MVVRGEANALAKTLGRVRSSRSTQASSVCCTSIDGTLHHTCPHQAAAAHMQQRFIAPARSSAHPAFKVTSLQSTSSSRPATTSSKDSDIAWPCSARRATRAAGTYTGKQASTGAKGTSERMRSTSAMPSVLLILRYRSACSMLTSHMAEQFAAVLLNAASAFLSPRHDSWCLRVYALTQTHSSARHLRRDDYSGLSVGATRSDACLAGPPLATAQCD